MSSYLNIFVRRKDESSDSNNKPICICSYTRSSNIYQEIYERINPAWAGDKEVYTELSTNDIEGIISEIKENILSTEKRISKYKELCNGSLDVIGDIIDLEEYLDELKVTLGSFYTLEHIVNNSKFNDNVILCNID